MSKKIQSTWANVEWKICNGILEKIKDLDKDNPKWVDYKQISNRTTSDKYYKGSKDRKLLHDLIYQKYLNKKNSKEKSICHFILGAMGAGKTSLKETIFELDSSLEEESIYINFDLLKKELPEYEYLKEINLKKASEFVQAESAKIAGNLFKKSIKKHLTIFFEKTLKDETTLNITKEQIKKALKQKYLIDIYLIVVSDEKDLQERVEERTKKNKRYVPPTIVSQSYKNLINNFNSFTNYIKEKGNRCRIYLILNEKDKDLKPIGKFDINDKSIADIVQEPTITGIMTTTDLKNSKRLKDYLSDINLFDVKNLNS